MTGTLVASPVVRASLGMYDFPWLRAANDALWHAVAARLRDAGIPGVPERLERARPLPELWRDPALILGQTCGYPYVSALRGVVRLVATPCYGWPGCEGARHRSVLLARAAFVGASLAEMRGRRLAINAPDSNSGMNLLRAAVAPLAGGERFFASVTITGAHLNSIEAVRTGAAALAAIDCVTHGIVQRDRPEWLAGTAVIGHTAPSPALPFVMAAGLAAAHLATARTALTEAMADPALAGACATLGLTGLQDAADADYDLVAQYERDAVRLGYPVLI